MTKKRVLSLLLVLCLVMSLTVVASAASYPDVDSSKYYAAAVQTWSDYGIVQGDGTGFRPEDNMTRAEAAAVFTRLLGLDSTEGAVKFTDVSDSAWYAKYIAMCSAAGIMNGTSSNPDYPTASPNATITRQEFFVLFARALGIEEELVSEDPLADDPDIATWAQGYLNAMIDEGYVRGNGVSINATGNIIRGDVMQVLSQTIDEYIGAPQGGNATNGTREAGYTYASQKAAPGGGKTALASRRASGHTFSGEYGRIASFALNLIFSNVQVRNVSNMAPNSRCEFKDGSRVEKVKSSAQANNSSYTFDSSSAASAVSADSENTSVGGSGVVAEFNSTTLGNNVTTPGTSVTQTQEVKNDDGSISVTSEATKNDENGRKGDVVRTESTTVLSSDGTLSVSEKKTVTDTTGVVVSEVKTETTSVTAADGTSTTTKSVESMERQPDGSTLTTSESSTVTSSVDADGAVVVNTKSDVTSTRTDAEGNTLYTNTTSTNDTTTTAANGDVSTDVTVASTITTYAEDGTATTIETEKSTSTTTSVDASGAVTETKKEDLKVTENGEVTIDKSTEETKTTSTTADGETTVALASTVADALTGETTTEESTTTTTTKDNGNVEQKVTATKTVTDTATGTTKSTTSSNYTSVVSKEADGSTTTKTTGTIDGQRVNTVTNEATNADGTVTATKTDLDTGKTTTQTSTADGVALTAEVETDKAVTIVDVETSDTPATPSTEPPVETTPVPTTTPSTNTGTSTGGSTGGSSSDTPVTPSTPTPTPTPASVTLTSIVAKGVDKLDDVYNTSSDVASIAMDGTTIMITVKSTTAYAADLFASNADTIITYLKEAYSQVGARTITCGSATPLPLTEDGAKKDDIEAFVKAIDNVSGKTTLIDMTTKGTNGSFEFKVLNTSGTTINTYTVVFKAAT